MLAGLTDAQVDYYLLHMPHVEARKNHAIAQLIADLREFIFPRYLDPDPNEKKEPPRRREPWRVAETLPPHAKYPEPEPMPLTAAEALVGAFDRLPAWAKDLAPLDEAKRALGAGPDGGHPEREQRDTADDRAKQRHRPEGSQQPLHAFLP